MFTEEHTTSVSLRASGIDRISRLSPSVPPFSTSAEYPPMKSTPISAAARSRARAMSTGSQPGTAEATMATGVTETRLLAMGIPSSRSIPRATGTRFRALVVTMSYTASQVAAEVARTQGSRLIPIVTVRMSSR